MLRVLLSKETMVLCRWGSRNKCFVLTTELMRSFGHCREIQVLTFVEKFPFGTKMVVFDCTCIETEMCFYVISFPITGGWEQC